MNCIKCGVALPEGAVFCHMCGRRQAPAPRRRKRGNGQGSAYKRGQSWTACWTEDLYLEDGKVRQKRRTKGGFPSKGAALAYLAGPRGTEKAPVTLRDYYRGWARTDYNDLSQSKQAAYNAAWAKLEPLAGKKMDALTIDNIQACIDSKAKTYYPARDMKTLLSHLFNRAVAEGNARANLAQYVRLPKLEEKELQPFHEEELKKLWAAYGDGERFAGCILLMVYSGMMPGELLALEPGMIDWEAREIRGAGKKTKKRKETPIVFPDVIAPVLDDLVQHSSSRSGKYVVGMNKDRFYQKYYEVLEKAGTRRLPPYSCRHTTATALALGNIAPSVIQEVMRHTKFTTTQRYIHPDTASTHAAVNSLKQEDNA